jgi:hypothetical protein
MFYLRFPFTQRGREATLLRERSYEWRTIMMKKIFAIALLSLGLAACEPSATDNSNLNSNARTTSSPAAPGPASPTPEPVASIKPELKAGDKVKVTIGGTAAEATVVSVDEKAGKATVKIHGQKEEKIVAIADIVKE